MSHPLPDWYLSHYIPKKFHVIGFDLLPYSIHHMIHLSAMESPLLDGVDPNATIQDLETACLICTTKHGDDVLKIVDDYNKSDGTKSYREQLFTHLKTNPSYLGAECIKFNQYKTACEMAPTDAAFGTPLEDQAPPSVPWPLTCVAALMREYGYSEGAAMNMPLAKAVALTYVARYLKDGECPIIGDAEILCIQLAKGLIKPSDVFGTP